MLARKQVIQNQLIANFVDVQRSRDYRFVLNTARKISNLFCEHEKLDLVWLFLK